MKLCFSPFRLLVPFPNPKPKIFFFSLPRIHQKQSRKEKTLNNPHRSHPFQYKAPQRSNQNKIRYLRNLHNTSIVNPKRERRHDRTRICTGKCREMPIKITKITKNKHRYMISITRLSRYTYRYNSLCRD